MCQRDLDGDGAGAGDGDGSSHRDGGDDVYLYVFDVFDGDDVYLYVFDVFAYDVDVHFCGHTC